MSRRGRPAAGTSPLLSPKRARRSEKPVNSRVTRDARLGGNDQAGRRTFLSDNVFVNRSEVMRTFERTEDSVLMPISLDLHWKENRTAHHTDEYEMDDLIVRRGQGFVLSLTFDREYNPEADTVIIQLMSGSRPQESKGTLMRLKMNHQSTGRVDDWSVTFKEQTEKTVKFTVVPEADAIVGRYQVYVETETKLESGKTHQQRREFSETFIVLFNAWCSADDVFLPDESWRNEYVLNQRGALWVGSARSNSGIAWNFGQMEDVCLEAALSLLDQAELSAGSRSNPVYVVRCMSKMTNSNDDDGVLTGRWTDTYPKGCTVPWAWTGSVAIIEEFMRTRKSVHFGQCWVFSGVITTLCRALGIPTRSVTNFESAHDTDTSMTIDYHWNEDDEPLPDFNDSVWNFHVWNEAFMKRPDLPPGYDGWQAFDSTPQELSEGVMQCGPAPVKAIHEGHVYLPYDVPFIFAEVNGDRVHWLVKKDGSMEVQSKETHTVGLNISTKAIGSSDREDITHQYKYMEGSAEERQVVHRAFRYSSRREHQVYNIPEPDVSFRLMVPDGVIMGDDFKIRVGLKNRTEEERHTTVKLTAVVSYYTGVVSEQVGQARYLNTLSGNAEGEIEFPVSKGDYTHLLKPESMVTVYLKGTVQETKRTYAHVESFHIRRPGLLIEAPERVNFGEKFDVTIKFTNPLTEKLTNGIFHIEAPGLLKTLREPHRKAIPPKSEVTHTFVLLARKAGEREILVNFSAEQLSGMTGEGKVYVTYSS